MYFISTFYILTLIDIIPNNKAVHLKNSRGYTYKKKTTETKDKKKKQRFLIRHKIRLTRSALAISVIIIKYTKSKSTFSPKTNFIEKD